MRFVLVRIYTNYELLALYSEIYCQCHGPLLHTVQMAKIFNDSKTFVDIKQKQKSEITSDLFMEFMAKNDDSPGQEAIREFVKVNIPKSHYRTSHASKHFMYDLWSHKNCRKISKSVDLKFLTGFRPIGNRHRSVWRVSKILTTNNLL